MSSDVRCTVCGKPAFSGQWRSGQSEVEGMHKPLAIALGQAMCHSCWTLHWDEVARSHVATLRRESGSDKGYDGLFDDVDVVARQMPAIFDSSEPYDFSLSALCRDCYEDYAEPGELLCPMCQYDHQRKGLYW